MSWIDDIRSELAAADLSPRAARNFALVLATALLALATWLALRRSALPAAAWLAVLALPLGAAGLLRPAVLRPIHRAWITLGLVLGWFASRLVLAVLFYGVVTPIGLLRRATREARRRRASATPAAPPATYWTRRAPRPARYEKMF